MTETNFQIAALPKIFFGRNQINKIPAYISAYGKRVLLVTGKESFLSSLYWDQLAKQFEQADILWEVVSIDGEPSPERIDEITAQLRPYDIEVVVAIGGGSAIDAGKAIAGLLAIPNSVMDFLEGVGPELPYPGPSVPCIAIPTTAGTGSEATKNAVLSVDGPEGFKKSFRDDQLIPKIAILDPALLASCSPAMIAANGMDALTQLMESYLSLNANPFTDALALSGLAAIRDALLPWYNGTNEATAAQEAMSYAAMNSGICLAQTGLGSVHGLASPLGAFFPIPHGVVCGTLVATAIEMNIKAMLNREPENIALNKTKKIAEILCNQQFKNNEESFAALIHLLSDWTDKMKLPLLSEYGITAFSFPMIVDNARGSSMRTNPIVLTDQEITNILQARC